MPSEPTESTHGHRPEVWARAKGEVRATLAETARRRGLISYTDLVRNVVAIPFPSGARSDSLFYLLGQVMKEEHDAGRPPLAAVAVRKREDTPGKGFYVAAKELGIGDGTENVELWVKELAKVHAFHSGA
jgi:hypothetical protein